MAYKYFIIRKNGETLEEDFDSPIDANTAAAAEAEGDVVVDSFGQLITSIPRDHPSVMGTFGRSLLSGATLSWDDEMGGLLNKAAPNTFDTKQVNREQKVADQEDNPTAAFLGKTIGGIAPEVVAQIAASRAGVRGEVGRSAVSATVGALEGAGSVDNSDDMLGGAAIGAGLTLLPRAAKGAIDPLRNIGKGLFSKLGANVAKEVAPATGLAAVDAAESTFKQVMKDTGEEVSDVIIPKWKSLKEVGEEIPQLKNVAKEAGTAQQEAFKRRFSQAALNRIAQDRKALDVLRRNALKNPALTQQADELEADIFKRASLAELREKEFQAASAKVTDSLNKLKEAEKAKLDFVDVDAQLQNASKQQSNAANAPELETLNQVSAYSAAGAAQAGARALKNKLSDIFSSVPRAKVGGTAGVPINVNESESFDDEIDSREWSRDQRIAIKDRAKAFAAQRGDASASGEREDSSLDADIGELEAEMDSGKLSDDEYTSVMEEWNKLQLQKKKRSKYNGQ